MAPTVDMIPALHPKQLNMDASENKVTSIKISEEQRLSCIPSAEIVGEAVGILNRDGIVVLENAVDEEHLRILNDKLCSEVPALIEDPNTHWNGGKARGNISQPPPFEPEYMFADIWANPFAIAIISALLGPRPHVNYVNGNTALPHTHGRQEVHADLMFNYPPDVFAIVANYYLCDTDDSNGATEVWLRSHKDTHFDLHQPSEAWIRKEIVEERSRTTKFPPIRPAVKRGSLVLRDLRLWHAGRANPSNDPRIMLAFVHYPWWYKNQGRLTLPESARPLLENISDRLVYDADFVDGPVDHTKTEFNANFESGNLAYRSTIPPRENISPFEKARRQAENTVIKV
ncbi:hypothetical protein CGLO_03687 [Colletotrichum gloeosporioides Cg-14]|uniref:Phytanoyl-CoA dioxygenase n=1 Tax=Colletotrichum gloeosporioides (strain Cg-14) TaxID=1237896 RepID=T0KVY7_COLGC|nr:hypothetical protein CGLO_03687 [Colletotrichum gloeosporioides Cg-14]